MIPLEHFAVVLQQLLPDSTHESERALLRQAFAGELEEPIDQAPARVWKMARILFAENELLHAELAAAAKDAIAKRSPWPG